MRSSSSVRDAEEFGDERVFQGFAGNFGVGRGAGHEGADFGLVLRDRQTLEGGGAVHALELAEGPVALRGFAFVEGALDGVGDAHEEDVVGPTESEFAGWCLVFFDGSVCQCRG